MADVDVAVVGAGPGGLVSALYLRRFLRSVALLSAGPPRASWIPRTYNLLGYRGGVSGKELLLRLESQVNDLGCERIEGEFRVFPHRGEFRLMSDKTEFTARRVILATGMHDIQPPISNLIRLRRKGLLRYCPVCDGFEYRHKRLVVLAQDMHGIKTAIFLRSYSRNTTVVWPLAQEYSSESKRLIKDENLKVVEGEIIGIEERIEGGGWVVLEVESGRAKTLRFDACYVALGKIINDIAFRHLQSLRRDDEGCLITGSHQELHIPGLFAVGDCVEGLAQISVAAGQAAVAATRVHNQLRQLS